MGLCQFRDQQCPVSHTPVTVGKEDCEECPFDNCEREDCSRYDLCTDCQEECEYCKDTGKREVEKKHEMVRCPVHSDKEQQ